MRLEDNYDVNVFLPGSTKDLWRSFSSESAFLGIHAGDLVDCTGWDGPRPPSATLRVVNVRHSFLQNAGKVRHLVNIFTEAFSGDIHPSPKTT